MSITYNPTRVFGVNEELLLAKRNNDLKIKYKNTDNCVWITSERQSIECGLGAYGDYNIQCELCQKYYHIGEAIWGYGGDCSECFKCCDEYILEFCPNWRNNVDEHGIGLDTEEGQYAEWAYQQDKTVSYTTYRKKNKCLKELLLDFSR